MSSIDDRIVNMQFNNKQFQSGAADSIKSLDNVEKALAKTARSEGLNGLAKGVDTVKTKFGAMQVAGVAALATITAKATAAGLNLIKSLTLDPVMAGFKEYQTGLDSIQTIMANTGKSVKVVNKSLDELNDFADQTIYNFGQMAKNVGTFTAAGVDLETSVRSIKGIANLAALSGSTAEQASTAMYQLSQAIASGRVNLQDWNSVVNAGMGGKNFQTALARTATAMGTLKESSIALVGPMEMLKINGQSFRESISAGGGGPQWLTSDVLVETLGLIAEGYSDAELKAKGFDKAQIKAIQSLQKRAFDAATQIKTLPQLVGVIRESIGSTFAGVFRTVLGDFKQSKKLWSDVGFQLIGPNGIITKAQNGITGFFEEWADPKGFDGRSKVIETFGKLFSNIGEIFLRVKRAFSDVFPPKAGNVLMSLTNGFTNLVNAFTITGGIGVFRDLRAIFAGFFSVLKIGITIVKGVWAMLSGFFGAIFQGSAQASGGIVSIIADVARVIIAFQKWITEGDKLINFMSGIGTVVGAFVAPLVASLSLVIKAFAALTSGGGVEAFMKQFEKANGPFSGFVDTVTEGLAKIFGSLEAAKNIVDPIMAKLGGLGEIAKNIIEGLADGFVGEAIGNLKNAIVGIGEDIITWIKGVLGIKSPSVEMAKVGIAIVQGLVEGIIGTISFITDSIGKIAGAILGGFKEALGEMDAIEIASFLNAIFTGALILSLKGITDSLGDIGSIFKDTFGALTNTLKSMQREVQARAIQAIAIAVGILVVSLIALTFIKQKKLAIALGAIGIMLAQLVGSLAVLSKISKGDVSMTTLAASIVLISAAMINLAIAVAILGNQDMETLAKGLGAMAIAMGIMVGALMVLAGLGPVAKGAGGAMLIMAFAMNILAGAVFTLGQMDVKTLAKGLGAIAVAMGIFTVGLGVLTLLGPGVAAAGAGIFIVSSAMVVLAAAIFAFGKMNIKTLAKGFGAFAIAMGIFVVGLGALTVLGPGTLAAAGAIFIMASAMAMLLPVILTFGNMDLATLAKGLGAFALIMGIFVLAIAALGAVALVVGPGLLMLGQALALVGLGMLAFGTGFALMAAAGTAGIAVLSLAFTTFMALLPSFAIQIAAAFVAFLQTIAAASPKIRKALVEIFKNVIGAVKDAIPEFTDMFILLISEGIRVLTESVPKFIELGFTIIDAFLKSAAEHAPDIVDSAVTLMTTFMREIGNHARELADAAGQMIVDFLEGIADAIDKHGTDIRNAGLDIAFELVDGLTGGLLSWGVEKIKGAVEELMDHIPGWAKKILGIESPSKRMIPVGEMVAAGVARGIASSTSTAVAAVVAMADAIIAAGVKSVAKAQRLASQAQKMADQAQARADATAKAADKLRKTNPEEAKKLAKLADKQQKAADAAQARADAAAERVSDVQAFEQADDQGKGDIKSAQAIDLAEKAQKALAEANANAAMAKKLQRTNRKAAKAFLEESKRDAAEARRFAEEAKRADAEADAFYAKTVEERIKAIEDERKAEADKKRRDEEFEKADAAGKREILQKEMEAAKLKAEEAEKQALAYLEQAKALAKTDAKKAQELLDLADEQFQKAKDAAEEAEQAKQKLQQGTTGGTTSSTITPSRSVLEDAASVVDRYSKSLAQAEEFAKASEQVIQFTQYNQSPEALTASEIYRQTKSLLTAQEVKMVAPTP